MFSGRIKGTKTKTKVHIIFMTVRALVCKAKGLIHAFTM